jgi:hypothetical protein
MLRIILSVAIVSGVCAAAAGSACAQTPPLVFTTPLPQPSVSQPSISIRSWAVVEERGLALWSGAASDFGTGVEVSTGTWTIRSVASMRTLPIDDHLHPTFHQVEVIRPMLSAAALSVAAGGGIRQEWDGTRVLMARALVGAPALGGTLQGSLLIERALAPGTVERDSADVITTVGWSRSLNRRLGIGVEGIGQDLEGFWNPAEADGGARLLLGPSLHVQSRGGDWTASATAGPVFHTASPAAASNGVEIARFAAGGHLGVFASASWRR